MLTLINRTRQPQTLESGVILAAAGTDGYIKDVEQLSEADRKRLVEPGHLLVREAESPKADAQSARKEAK